MLVVGYETAWGELTGPSVVLLKAVRNGHFDVELLGVVLGPGDPWGLPGFLHSRRCGGETDDGGCRKGN